MTAVQNPLGNPIPAYTEHAISVSLPEWADNVGYEEGEARVVDAMQTGYPRFFIHTHIKKVGVVPVPLRPAWKFLTGSSQLSFLLEQKFSTFKETSLLFPSCKSAEACRAFLSARDVTARVVQHCISDTLSVFPVLFPESHSALARQFWQHTGLGISSRFAARVLAALAAAASPPPTPTRLKTMAHRHYAPKASSRYPSSPPPPPSLPSPSDARSLEEDQAVYLEQRYGRNLDVAAAEQAKRALRRRIAGVLVRDESAGDGEVELSQSVRGVAVTEDDVYLFPTGMSAIWNAHQLALDARGEKKSVCFGCGFPISVSSDVVLKSALSVSPASPIPIPSRS
jgi:cystathionine gamma-synthase